MILVQDIRDIATQFSDARAPHYKYQQVAPAAQQPQKPPPFLLGPATAETLWEIFGEIETPEAGCYVIEGATVAPTGFPIKDGVALHGTAFLHPRHHVVSVSDRLNASDWPVRDVAGPLAVIYGPGHETWGHWLTDFVPRLWVLLAAGHDLAKLRFLLPPDLKPFVQPLLALCGIRRDQCVIYAYWRELIRTDCLLMPTGLRAGNRFATCFAQATAWWTGLARAGIGTERFIFLSRAAAPQQREMINRPDVEAAAAQAGYVVAQPESLSITEQVALFSGARVLVGEYGSALHNTVFGGPGVLAIGLRGTSRHPSFVQSGIATALDQGAAYVFGDTGGQDITQRFVIEPRWFCKALELARTIYEDKGSKEALLF